MKIDPSAIQDYFSEKREDQIEKIDPPFQGRINLNSQVLYRCHTEEAFSVCKEVRLKKSKAAHTRVILTSQAP